MKTRRKSAAAPKRSPAQPETPDWRRIRWLIAGAVVLCIGIAAFIVIGSQPHRLTAEERAMMVRYDAIRAALAHDDLARAKSESSELASRFAHLERIAANALQLAKSESLETARAAFSRLSAETVPLAARNSGYYIMHCATPCPMDCQPCLTVRLGRWVQKNAEPENPFMGLAQLRCGTVDRRATAMNN